MGWDLSWGDYMPSLRDWGLDAARGYNHFIPSGFWLFHPLEQVFDIMLDFELLEEVEILILEGLLGVMLFLIQNVVVHVFDGGMAVRKRPVSLLPTEPALDPLMVVDEIAGVVLHVPHEVRESHRRFLPYEGMHVVIYAVDDDRFLSLVFDDARHVLEHFVAPFFGKQVLPSLHSKDDLNVDLGICACHGFLHNPEGGEMIVERG